MPLDVVVLVIGREHWAHPRINFNALYTRLISQGGQNLFDVNVLSGLFSGVQRNQIRSGGELARVANFQA